MVDDRPARPMISICALRRASSTAGEVVSGIGAGALGAAGTGVEGAGAGDPKRLDILSSLLHVREANVGSRLQRGLVQFTFCRGVALTQAHHHSVTLARGPA
jgi:hypothetical protein